MPVTGFKDSLFLSRIAFEETGLQEFSFSAKPVYANTLQVSHIQFLCDIVAGVIAWPLCLDRFTWLKYIDPIVL
jgi:hypothetical protein